MKYQWKVDLGYKNRWLKRCLSKSVYHDYIYLVQGKEHHSILERLFFMESFVQKIAIEVSQVLNFCKILSIKRVLIGFRLFIE
ncbi:MAG: aminoglycoside 6-adenylyltransferase [Turicibacter sp.]|nr:aminoglycoside 6-adenylyltransferase [Turicibacter sp.]